MPVPWIAFCRHPIGAPSHAIGRRFSMHPAAAPVPCFQIHATPSPTTTRRDAALSIAANTRTEPSSHCGRPVLPPRPPRRRGTSPLWLPASSPARPAAPGAVQTAVRRLRRCLRRLALGLLPSGAPSPPRRGSSPRRRPAPTQPRASGHDRAPQARTCFSLAPHRRHPEQRLPADHSRRFRTQRRPALLHLPCDTRWSPCGASGKRSTGSAVGRETCPALEKGPRR